MNNLNLKEIVENLIDTFIHAGKISLDLRKQGLIKKIKADNTPVSNGCLLYTSPSPRDGLLSRMPSSA